jgi:2-polyprenyl-6-methoxyphenol hydroxylase-like FAD-dependent oxidoreductase
MLTALLLKQNGIETQIIDQEFRTAGHSYSCALHPRSIQLLFQAGVAVEAISTGRRIDSVGFYEGINRCAEVKLSDLKVEFPFAMVLEQSTLENLLEQQLKKAGVKINWSSRLADFEMRDTGVTATIEKLGATGKGYSVPDFEPVVVNSRQVEAGFVIGTDGSNSLVRRRLKTPFERIGPVQHFAVYEIAADADCGGEVRVVLDDNNAGVLWPLSETHCRWSLQIKPDKEGDDFPQKDRYRLVIAEPSNEEDSLHHLRRLLKERAPWFKTPIEEVCWTTDVQFEPRVAAEFGKDRCWLAGDAAHQTGPVGMQSMNIGFREAADLVAALKEKVLKKNGSPDLLRHYESEHRAEWQKLLNVKPTALTKPAPSDWVRRRADRIIGSIPASGPDLNLLVRRLGIEF